MQVGVRARAGVQNFSWDSPRGVLQTCRWVCGRWLQCNNLNFNDNHVIAIGGRFVGRVGVWSCEDMLKRKRSFSTTPTCIWKGPVRPKAPLIYDELLSRAPRVRITVEDLNNFAAEKAGIDKTWWSGSARWWYRKLLENDTVVEKIPPDVTVVGDETFPHFVSSDSHWKSRVELSNGEVVVCLNTDMYSLWDAVDAWLKHRQRTTGCKLDNGWYRHAVKLAARYQWWVLTGTENWHRDVQKGQALTEPRQPCDIREDAEVEHESEVSCTQIVVSEGDIAKACRDLQEVLNDLPLIHDGTVRAAVRRADAFIERKREEGDDSIEAPLIFLGHVPELANHPSEMTTGQVGQYIKNKFKCMTKGQFARGWYGIEAYFKEHPAGKGYVVRKGWMSIDHVLAQYFGVFHHPRFYALMPPGMNAHLKNSPPIARMGFGMKRHELLLMHTWMKDIESSARRKRIQDALLADMVARHPVRG